MNEKKEKEKEGKNITVNVTLRTGISNF